MKQSMRLLLWLSALFVLSSCTCGGCQRSPSAPINAGPAVTATTLATSAVPAATTEPTDGAIALPSEVTENAPSTEALIAAFTADCHHHVTLTFEDMDGTHPDAGECDARMFDQNCSPDTFGCWEGVEQCRDACADPCHTCQSVCADRCDSCKSQCNGAAACITACATSRVDCRVQCLGRLETCRTTTCDAAMSRCEAEAQVRLKRLCPDCDAITSCQLEASERDQDAKHCAAKFPHNAAECLDWCTPGE